MHILIVEDDEVARDYLAKALREVGHTVDVAGNGLEGLHLASSIAVDLAIVDRMLPKLDGLALVQSLRATGRKMPVLILRTGILRPVARSDCTKASPSSFGSMRSTIARSTAIEDARCSPSRPFPATSTVCPTSRSALAR